MLAILYALGKLAVDLLKSRSRLEAENLLFSAISSTSYSGSPPFRFLPTCIINTPEYNFRKEQQYVDRKVVLYGRAQDSALLQTLKGRLRLRGAGALPSCYRKHWFCGD